MEGEGGVGCEADIWEGLKARLCGLDISTLIGSHIPFRICESFNQIYLNQVDHIVKTIYVLLFNWLKKKTVIFGLLPFATFNFALACALIKESIYVGFILWGKEKRSIQQFSLFRLQFRSWVELKGFKIWLT